MIDPNQFDLSEEAKRRRSCGDKIPHMSEEVADKWIKDFHKSISRKAHKMVAYQCRFCSHWHVGHKIGTKKLPKPLGDFDGDRSLV